MPDRRQFLTSSLAIGGAAAFGDRAWLDGGLPRELLPSPDVYAQDEETYWAQVRRQFLIPQDVIFLNNGTVGSSPKPVLRAVFVEHVCGGGMG